jgi:YHS domain-containing protein
MASLDDLEQRIRAKLAVGEQHRKHEQGRLRQGMEELGARVERYAAVAERLRREIIRPRFDKLAACFDNASVDAGDWGAVACRFERTERFPATASVEVGLTRDGEARSIEVWCETRVAPAYLPVPGEGHLVLPLDDIDEGKLAAWIEERIVAFVDVYLRLESAGPYQEDNEVTDPVCGMRLNKLYAAAQAEHQRMTFFFCVEDCRQKFLLEPDRYLKGGPGGVRGDRS